MSNPKYDTVSGTLNIDAIKSPKEYPYDLSNIAVGAEYFHPASTPNFPTSPVGDSRYDYGITPEMEPYLDLIRAQRQSGWNQLGNASIQALAEVFGGTIEGIGYLANLNALSEAMMSGEEYFGNALSRFGKSIRDESREAFPIYTDAEGFAPGNWSWWMSNAPSIASSISLMVPSGAAVGIIRGAGKALGLASKMPKALSRTMGVFGQAALSRHMENMMEAAQSYDDLYEMRIAEGMSVQDARKNAAIGASTIYKADWAMLGQDILQYAFLGGVGRSAKGLFSGVDDVAKTAAAMGKSTVPVYAKNALMGLGNMAGEFGEEAYQYVIQKEGEYLAQKALDPSIESQFSERMSEYVRDGELWTAGFFGALGAGVMQGTMKGINRKLKGEGKFIEDQVKNIGTWGAETSRLAKTFLVASETGSTKIANANFDQGLANILTKAFQYNNVGRFEEFTERMKNPSQEDLDTFGISSEDAQLLSEQAEEISAATERFKEIHAKNEKKLNNNKLKSPAHALMASRNEFLIERVNDQLEESKSRISELESMIPNLNDMSLSGQREFNLKRQVESIDGDIQGLKAHAESSEVEGSVKTKIEETINKLSEQKEEFKKEIKKIQDNKTDEEKKKDKDKDTTSPVVDELTKELANKHILETELSDLQKDLKLIQKGIMPYEHDPMYPATEDLTTNEEIPQKKDLVVYTEPQDPEDPTPSKQSLARVEKVEDEGTYVIQLIDNDTGEKLGDKIKVAVENLKRVVKASDTDPNVEPDDTLPVDRSYGETDGDAMFIESVSYVYEDIVDLTKSKKWRLSAKINDPDHAVDIPIHLKYVNLDKSGLEDFMEDVSNGIFRIKKVLLLQTRGLNNEGVAVGDIRIITEEGVVEASVFFKGKKLYTGKKIVRNVPLDEIISNPKTDLSDAKVSFQIDWSYKEFWDKNKSLYDELKGGKLSLSAERIESLKDNLIDNIPIKVYITIDSATKSKGLYLHTTQADVIRIPKHVKNQGAEAVKEYVRKQRELARTTRYNILNKLLAGKKVVASGLNVMSGAVNISEKSGNISEKFNQPYKEISIGVGDRSGSLNEGDGKVHWNIPVPKGGAFAITTKTPNGKPRLVKLNNTKLSKESAEILFDALKQAYDVKGGFGSRMKSDLVEGLSAGQVVNLLAYNGEQQTSVDLETNKGRLGEHMRSKQLYVKKDENGTWILHFGDQQMPFMSKKDVEEKKKVFVEWATKNKNYPVIIQNERLGITGVNSIYKKKFRIGSLVHDGESSYSTFLMKHNLVTTNVTEFVPGSLFHRPVLKFDHTTIRLAGEEVKEKSSEKEPVPKATKDLVQKEEGNLKTISSKKEFAAIPNGSELFVTKHHLEGENEVLEHTKIADIKDGKVDVLLPYKDTGYWAKIDGKKITDPNVVDIIVKEAPLLDITDIKASVSATQHQSDDIKVQTEETKEDDQDITSLGDYNNDDIMREFKEEATYVVQNLKKDLRSVRRMLGKKVSNNYKEVDKLINIANSGRLAFAIYKHDVVSIFKNAETGTAYHEAFHRVSLAYLTPQEREDLYDAARREYSLRGLTDREVEEFLAEKFRDYVISRGNMTFVEKVADFFKNLYNSIVAFFTGPTRLTEYEVNKLFRSIYLGKYKYQKVLPENVNLLKEGVPRDFYGHDFSTLDTIEDLKGVIKSLTYELFRLSGIKDFDNLGTLDFEPLIKGLESSIKGIKSRLGRKDVSEDEKELLKLRLASYTDLLGLNKDTGIYETFEVVKDLIIANLRSMQLKPKFIDPDNYNDEADDLSIEQYSKQSIEVDPKENARGNVKVLIGLLPRAEIIRDGEETIIRDVVNPITSLKEFVDFNETWNTLLGDLYEFDNIDDMIIRLTELIPIRPEYKTIVERLNRNKDNILKAQFETTIKNHRNSYINALSSFGDGKQSFNFADADVRSVSTSKLNEWSLNFHLSDNVDRKGKAPRPVEHAITEIKRLYKSLADEIRNHVSLPTFEEQFLTYYDRVLSLLNDVNIAIDARTLDYIVENGKKSYGENFADFVLNKMETVVTNVIGNYNPEAEKAHTSRIYKDNSVTKFIADSYAKAHPEQLSVMVLGPENAQYYSYSNHSTVTSLIRDIKLNPALAAELLTKVNNRSSKFLLQLAENQQIRKGLRVLTFAGIFDKSSIDEGRDYFAMSHIEDYLTKLHAVYKGMVAFPTLADKKTYYFLDGLNTLDVDIIEGENGNYKLSQDVIDELYKHVEDEYERISIARNLLETYKDLKKSDPEAAVIMEANMVENYHYVTDKNGNKDFTKGNAYNFITFKGLDFDTFNEETVKANLPIVLTNLIQEELKYAISLGIIRKRDGVYKALGIDTNIMNKLKEEFGQDEHNAVVALFTKHVVRSIDNNIELHKMFIGDPAFYKADKNGDVATDLGKRLGSLIASGEEMIQSVDKFGDELKTSTFNVSTIQTQKLESTYYNKLMEIYTQWMSEKEAKDILKPYLEVEQADGQSFVTPRMYRSISIRIGEWSPLKEDAYNLLMSGKELTAEETSVSLQAMFNPLKTVYFGYDFVNQLAVPTYDKMSMAVLLPSVVKGTQMETVLEYMEKNNIDMLKMDSATKTGNRGAVPLFKDKAQTTLNDLNKLNVHPQQFKNLYRQQATPVHSSERSVVGTQVIKMAMSNLNFDDSVSPYLFKGKKKTGNQIASIINKSLSSLSKKGKERRDASFGIKEGVVNKRKMTETMRREALMAGSPMSMIEHLTTEQGDFSIHPDALPNRKWWHSRVISFSNKHIIDRKLPGGQFIQVSNLGFRSKDVSFNLEKYSYDSHVEWLTEVKDIPFVTIEDGKVVPMGTVVSISLFRHLIPDYDNRTFDEKKEFILKHKLDILGYRIPTQGQSSTIPMRIVGLLPENTGDSIILPSEFTALTGSDFDIDKLFVMRKNYAPTKDGIAEIEFITNNDEEAYNRMLFYKFALYRSDFDAIFKDWYYNYNIDRVEWANRFKTGNPETDAEIGRLLERIKALKEAKKKTEVQSEIDKYRDQITELYMEIDVLTGQQGVFDRSRLTRPDFKKLLSKIEEQLLSLGAIETREEFSKLDDYDKNIPKAVENQMLDAYMAILTSEEHFVKTTSPLGGITNKLKAKAEKVREFRGDEERSMLSMFTPKFQSEIKARYTAGKQGVGPFALHNTHHVLTQLAQYAIFGGISKLQNYIQINDMPYLDLAAQKGHDGVYILDWLSALIDAHVDLAKDPYIIDLNVNPFTYDIAAYLIRTGLGERAFDFLSMEGIEIASKIHANSRRSIFNRRPLPFYKVVEEAILQIAYRGGLDTISMYSGAERISPEVIEMATLRADNFFIEGEESIESKLFKGEVEKNKDYYIDQIAALIMLGRIKDDANILTSDVQSSQVDNKKFGSTLIEIEAFINKVRQSYVAFEKGDTINYDKIIPFDPENITSDPQEGELYTAEYFRNSVADYTKVFSDITINSTAVFRKAMYNILTLSRSFNIADPKVLNKVSNELFSAILGKFVFADNKHFAMTPEKLKGLMVGENNIFVRFDKLKADHPDLFKNNSLLKRLTTFIDESTKEVPNYFLMKETSFKESMEIDDVVYAWEDLLNHEDPEVNKFARHLQLYLFYTTGFNNRVYGFNNLIPPSMMKGVNINGRVISVDEAIKGLMKRMTSPEFESEMISVMDDVMSHVHMFRDLAWDVRLFKADIDEASLFYIEPKRASKYNVGTSKAGHAIFVPYIKREGVTYKYRGYVNTDSTLLPIYTIVDNKGHYKLSRYLFEYGLDNTSIDLNVKEGKVDKITQKIKDKLSKQLGGNFVEMNNTDIYGFGLSSNVEEITDETQDTEDILENEEVKKEEKPAILKLDGNKLSNEKQPLEIYTDGSDIKGTGQIGSGVWFSYNGVEYSRSDIYNVDAFKKRYNMSENVSNPTMEVLALINALDEFKDTGEHLVIYSDYEGVQKWVSGEWKAKKPYIQDIVRIAKERILSIENNGGSVILKHVPGHSGILGNEKVDAVAKDRKSYNTIRNLILRVAPIKPYESDKLKQLGEQIKESEKVDIYSKLGSVTKSENVVIKPWNELKDATIAVTEEGIISTRIKNSNEHFGNPFSSDERVLKANPSLIKVNSTKEAVRRYIEWVLTSDDSRAIWIRERVKSGELKGKPIFYYKELGQPSHATALDYLINKHSFSTETTTDQTLSEYTNHSGGAVGSDTKWDEIGAEFGMVNNKHYYYGKKTSKGNTEITKEQLEEGWKRVQLANRTLKRKPENYKGLLSRNWFQVKNADTVFAIGKVNPDNKTVDGGTGWAVQMAIDSNKPVYVFDQLTNKWLEASWTGDGQFFGFEEVEQTPILTKNFAGIGTREITQEGEQAIRDVYEATLGDKIAKYCKGQ